jgi:hypothetical protein
VQVVVVAEVACFHAGGLETLDPVRRALQALGQLLQLGLLDGDDAVAVEAFDLGMFERDGAHLNSSAALIWIFSGASMRPRPATGLKLS